MASRGIVVAPVTIDNNDYVYNQRLVDAKAEGRARFRDDGWSFITFEEALKDDVYRLKYDYVGVQGAGHLDAIGPATR
jgi:hypothetical protein